MSNNWYFFLFFLFATALSIGLLLFVWLIRYRRQDYGDKRKPYECGLDPLTSGARDSYSIRFYLLALVFIVFEVETIFLFPWAVIYGKLGLFGFIEMAIFLLIVLVGYVYAWRVGALEFRREID
ncbi:MAG TPA: NADH-quinone oxidoreductase subunit A [Candidatus Aminicenantes bacterium]|nr:NADH-quinone oxidoreductase subunit A [Candidatus Aminicenantes bacterium]